MYKVLVSAGEASGDLHAGALTREILRLEPKARVFGVGGGFMRAAGGEVLFDIKDYGVMGFVEVIGKLPALFRLRSRLARLMDEERPDCLVVIDYPDFNMRLAKIAHQKKIPVISFISPSAWAWRRGRARRVAEIVDWVAAVFPFERDVYQEAGARVSFVGHPLLDIVRPSLPAEEAEKLLDKRPGQKTVLLLPGSRRQEIDRLLPEMLRAAAIMKKQDADCAFYLLRAPTVSPELLEKYCQGTNAPPRILTGPTYDIMKAADAAVAASGTVTLEAALCGLPSVIVYKTSPITAFIARRLVKVNYIGLPNIVAGRQILPELLQEDATGESMAKEALLLLAKETRSVLAENLAAVRAALGEPGAAERVARLVLSVVYSSRIGGTE